MQVVLVTFQEGAEKLSTVKAPARLLLVKKEQEMSELLERYPSMPNIPRSYDVNV